MKLVRIPEIEVLCFDNMCWRKVVAFQYRLTPRVNLYPWWQSLQYRTLELFSWRSPGLYLSTLLLLLHQSLTWTSISLFIASTVPFLAACDGIGLADLFEILRDVWFDFVLGIGKTRGIFASNSKHIGLRVEIAALPLLGIWMYWGFSSTSAQELPFSFHQIVSNIPHLY